MTSADELEEIWTLFEQDGIRALDEAEQHILALQSTPESENDLHGLYRALHSLKGNARVMGLANLEALTHKTEDLVGLCRDGACELSEELFESILESADLLRELVPATVETRADVPEERVSHVVEQLGELLSVLDTEGTRAAATTEDGAVFEGFLDVDFDFDFPDLEGVEDAEEQAASEAGDASDHGDPAGEAEPSEAAPASPESAAVASQEVSEVGPAGSPAPSEGPAADAGPASEPIPADAAPADAAPAEVEPPAAAAEPPAPKAPPEPPPKPAAPKPAPKAAAQRDTIVQVRRSKIQELLSIASDLGLSTDGLLSHPGVQQLREDSEDLTEKAHRLRRLMRDLRFAAAGLALVPVNELYAKVKRIGRELQRATGKVFTLEFEGEETEIDKSLVDALSDPVLHIIRNAVDHGIESADDRVAAAKPRQGKVTVSASYSGNEVLLVFSDDGKGLNGEVLRRKAIERGLITETDNLDTTAIHRLILHPGFSTRDTVTELSGRGVGMDVVSESIKQLRGRIDIRSVQGQGTSFLIFLPLTLAFSDALVVEAGPFLYAIPLENVGRILLPEESDWTENRASSAEMLRVQGNLYPVHWITGTGGEREGDEQRKPVVVVQTSGGGVALPVDFLRGTEQITMRPLSGLTRHHPAASSCGILSNGDLALTLDCERLIKVRADDDESDRASASS